MKKLKSSSTFYLDLDSLGSLLEIYPDTEPGDEMERYYAKCQEMLTYPQDNISNHYVLHDSATAHIKSRHKTDYKNLISMSADSHALARDWKNIGIDIAKADKLLRSTELSPRIQKDLDAIKYGS